MSIPTQRPPEPAAVRRLAAGSALEAAWENELDGVTFRTGDGRYIKYGPRNAETTMRAEAERMRWAHAFTPVPEVLEEGGDDGFEWLATVALPGDSAVAPRWVQDAATAVRAIGEGLRAFHDALPVDECPFDWGVPARVANAATRGIRVPTALQDPPPIDRLVVCHGDACAPNTLIGEDGRWAAHVDLGALGRADRWADIAVAAMSAGWNYGPGWEGTLLDAYGVEADPERMQYYRDLWNAT